MNSILRKENVSCKGEGIVSSETLLSQDTFALNLKVLVATNDALGHFETG